MFSPFNHALTTGLIDNHILKRHEPQYRLVTEFIFYLCRDTTFAMMKLPFSKWTVLFFVYSIVTLTGCASRLNLTEQQAAFSQQLPNAWHKAAATIGTAVHLEELTANPELKALIEEALKANPNITATAYRLRASGLLLSIPASNLLPSATLGGKATRTHTKEGETDSYSATGTIQWEIDLWGRLADQYDAELLGVSASKQDYIAARNALIARVIQGWVTLSSQKLAVEIQQRRIKALKDTEDIALDRYNMGIGQPQDLATAKANTESAKQVLIQKMLTVSKAQRTLEILLGRYPAGIINGQATLPVLASPVVNMPSSVLTARPDIQSAWLKVRQSDKSVAAANKAMLPSFTLSADLGYSSNAFNQLASGPSVWNLVSSVSQPLFMGGKLINTAQARSEECKAAWEDYRKVVLNAAVEVENALEAESNLQQQEAFLESSLKYARQSRINYEQQYREGLTDILNLLTAKNNELNTEAQLLDVRTSRVNNRMTLAIAAGLSSQKHTPNVPTPFFTSSIKETTYEN